MNESGNHWTNDGELLSKFAMHQLPPDEEEKLSNHLSTCEQCRREAEKEVRIVAGAKSAGRAEMKQRLKSRLAANEKHRDAAAAVSFQIPWARVASIAAILAILISAGIYNNWFNINFGSKSTTPEEVVQEQHLDAKPTRRDTRQTSPQAAEQKKLAQSTNAPENARSKTPEGRTDRLQESAKADKGINVEKSGTLAPAESPGAGASVAMKEKRRAENAIGLLADETTIATQREFWIEGHIIAPEVAQRGASHEQDRENSKAQSFVYSQAQSLAKKDSKQLMSLDANGSTAEITLRQKPSSSLPTHLQNRENNAGVVQTSIENGIDGVQMTLYLDALVPDSELQTAHIQTIGNDSLLLNVSGQQIGYRLPVALQSQVNKKAKR